MIDQIDSCDFLVCDFTPPRIVNKYTMQATIETPVEHPLQQLMQSPLPTKTYQRKKLYHPTREEAAEVYDLLNDYVFGGVLVKPPIIFSKCHNFWGQCYGAIDLSVIIQINHRHLCKQWFIAVLAHEMVHQYQWQIDGAHRQSENPSKQPLMSHGPTFVKWKKALKEFGIPLSTSLDADEFLKHQDIMNLHSRRIKNTEL